MIARINESKKSTKIYHAHVNLNDKKSCIKIVHKNMFGVLEMVKIQKLLLVTE